MIAPILQVLTFFAGFASSCLIGAWMGIKVLEEL
jgi:hypothetical protein